MKLTKQQKKALFNVYSRIHKPAGVRYTAFRRACRRDRKIYYDNIAGCLMVYWSDMWLGIEPNGYCHS